MKFKVPVLTNIQLYKYVEVEDPKITTEAEAVDEVRRRCEEAAYAQRSDDPLLAELTEESVQDALKTLRYQLDSKSDLEWFTGLLDFEGVMVNEMDPVVEIEPLS
jgi:hypothetical protein